jgi:hypothetical protein
MNLRTVGAALIATLLVGATASASLGAALPRGSEPDVLVVGGTPAGVAAAVAAARDGARVELVARRAQLGGILTDAMMDQWDLNLARDGAPIEGGLFSEIYAALGDSFTPAQAAAEFSALVAGEPRIDVLTDAIPIAVRSVDDGPLRRVTDVTFQRGDERISIAAPDVVDASDDGDVAALAGARYDLGRQDTGRDERMQPVTLIFTVTGVDWSALVAGTTAADGPGGVTPRRAWGYAQVLRAYHPASANIIVDDLNLGHEDGGSVTVNAIDVDGIDGRDPADLERARAVSEREAPRLVAWLRGRLPGWRNAEVGRYADALYVRETRHFAGLERLTADDVWDGVVPGDSIGLSSYPLDLHPVQPTDKPAFAPVRHVYGVPFGALVPRGFGNLLLASPAISASHLAAGSARIIPTTIEEGEAAGSAAAQALRAGLDFATFARTPRQIGLLQADLARRGVLLPPAIVGHARTADHVALSESKRTLRSRPDDLARYTAKSA